MQPVGPGRPSPGNRNGIGSGIQDSEGFGLSNRRTRRGKKAVTGPTCLGFHRRSSGARSPADIAIRPCRAICLKASLPQASLLAHHQYRRTPTPIATPGTTIDRWAEDHSLREGEAKSGRPGTSIETTREMAHKITPSGCASHDGENRPLRCQTRNQLSASLANLLRLPLPFGPMSIRCVWSRVTICQLHTVGLDYKLIREIPSKIVMGYGVLNQSQGGICSGRMPRVPQE